MEIIILISIQLDKMLIIFGNICESREGCHGNIFGLHDNIIDSSDWIFSALAQEKDENCRKAFVTGRIQRRMGKSVKLSLC